MSSENPREPSADARGQAADERERIADDRDTSSDQRAADAERRQALADALEAALRQVASEPSADALAELTANADDRARNAAAQAAQRKERSSAPGTPDGGEAIDADRHEFLADDREQRADVLEALQDEAERLADLRERQLRFLASDLGMRATDDGAGAGVAWPAASELGQRDADNQLRVRAAASRRAANIARAEAHRGTLAVHLVAITQALVRTRSVEAVLSDVVEAAHRVVQGCDAATFAVVRGGALITVAATDPAAAALDGAQDTAGEGPSIEAIATMSIVQTNDLAADARWPGLRAQAAEPRFGSILSAGVADERRQIPLGSLNLYRTTPGPFTDEGEECAILLAAHLGAVMALAAAADEADARLGQMSDAIQTRDVIGQAKGILMERRRLTADQAFDVLVRASQALNRKLRDVAEELSVTGLLD